MKKKNLFSFLLAGALALTGLQSNLTVREASAAAGTRVSVHDPSVVKDGSTYYVFGSHIEAARSENLRDWQRFSNGYARTNNVEFGNLSQNLSKAFAWAGEDLEDCAGGFAVWAPDVFWDADFVNTDGSKGAYLMYFCTSSTYKRSVIAFAASKKITGPYTFVDTLIYSGFTSNDSWATSNTKRVNRKYTSTNIPDLENSGQVSHNNAWFSGNGDFNNQQYPNAIDPTIYTDTDGRMYMCYGSWSGGIFTLEIDRTTGKCIHPKTGKTSDGRMIDSYFGTKISGGWGKSGEGPFIEYNKETGYYYLWVTYGGLTSNGNIICALGGRSLRSDRLSMQQAETWCLMRVRISTASASRSWAITNSARSAAHTWPAVTIPCCAMMTANGICSITQDSMTAAKGTKSAFTR